MNDDIVLISKRILVEIANTIRDYGGTAGGISPAEFVNKIRSIANPVSYISEEAKRVADAISSNRETDSLVLLCASDIHTLMTNSQSVETTLHLAQGINEICKRIAVDGVAILGDMATGGPSSTIQDCKDEIGYLRNKLGGTQDVPQIWMAGNHDHNSQNSTAGYLTPEELYEAIGANTTNLAVTDPNNLNRLYGYVDYEDQKIRVIYLNTADITDHYSADYGVSTVQAQWLVNTLASVPSEWGVVVMSHHPLNGYISQYIGILTILNAYKGRTSGSLTVGGGTVSYNFTNATGEFICHLHGHIHNYQAAAFGSNKVVSITIPNGSFWRNNEYGTGGNTDWGDTDANGNQRVFAKTAGTAKDTAYTAIVINRDEGRVYAIACGAGIDRVWDYVNGVAIDSETPDTPTPDEPDTGYVNQIPISIDTDGNIYNGTGYKAGYRISTSAGTESVASGMTVTGYIPLPNANSVVRVKDIDLTSGDSTMGRYTSDFTFAGGTYCNSAFGAADENGVRSYTNTSENCKWIRISGAFGSNPIITVDEEIPESGGGGDNEGDDTNGIVWYDGKRFSSSSGELKSDDGVGQTSAYLPMDDISIGQGYQITGLVFDGSQYANSYVTAYEGTTYTGHYFISTGIEVAFGTHYTATVASDGSSITIYKNSEPTGGASCKVGVTGGGLGANAVVTIVGTSTEPEPEEPEVPDTPDEPVTGNLVPTATDATGAVFNSVGYMAGKRWGSSATGFSTYKDAESTQQVLFGMVPFTLGQTLTISGGQFISGYASNNMFKTFDANRNNLATGYLPFSTASTQYPTELVISGDSTTATFSPTTTYSPYITENMAYIAISIYTLDPTSVVITVE